MKNKDLNNYQNIEIKEGMDITEKLYSDTACYYVTKVIDNRHFLAKSYHTCADQEKAGGMGHQNWLFFKSLKDMENYLKRYHPETQLNCEGDKNDYDEEFVYRYNHWYKTYRDRENKKHYSKVKLTFNCRHYYYDWEC